MKGKIGLVVDEGADLLPETFKENQIEIVPVKLNWPQVQNLPGQNIYQKMREAEKRGIKSFGKTSQPSPKDFLNAYKKQLELFEKIICITLTSKLSGTYNSAMQAKSFLPADNQKGIFVVDSLSVSGGEALLALKALELIKKEDKSAEEIAQELKLLPYKIRLRVIFKDPKWVEASGRISKGAANWIRKMQKIGIYPLLGTKEGLIKPTGVKIGVKSISEALFNDIKKQTEKAVREKRRVLMIINHGDNLEEAEALKEKIEKEINNSEILFINLVNNIVGAIAGPDALALSWLED